MKKQMNVEVPTGTFLLTGCFLLGGLLGFVMAGCITAEGEGSLADFFLSYFSYLQTEGLSPSLGTAFKSSLKTPLYAVLLGFSLLGVIGLPILFGVEGFLFSFSVSTLCRLLGATGLIPAFFLFCMPACLWVPTLFLTGLQSYRAAFLLWQRCKPAEIYTKGYFLRLGIGMLMVLLSTAFEFFILPILLEAILPFVA